MEPSGAEDLHGQRRGAHYAEDDGGDGQAGPSAGSRARTSDGRERASTAKTTMAKMAVPTSSSWPSRSWAAPRSPRPTPATGADRRAVTRSLSTNMNKGGTNADVKLRWPREWAAMYGENS